MAVKGRPREFDRDAALEVAMLAFWQKGYSGTSTKKLCAALGIGSPSLYAAFGNKEALYAEAIEQYVKSRGAPLWDEFLHEGTARDAIKRLLTASAEAMPGSCDRPAACMISLGGVGDAWPDAVAAVPRQLRLGYLDHLRTRLSAAVADGELPSTTDIEQLSRFFLGVIQAMAVQAKDGAEPRDLIGLAETAMSIWPSA